MIDKIIMWTIFILVGWAGLHLIPYLLVMAVPIAFIVAILGKTDEFIAWIASSFNNMRSLK